MMTAGKLISWIVISLLAFAVLMVNSAGMSLREEPLTWESLITGRAMMYAILAICGMFAMSMIDIRKLYQTSTVKNPLFWLMIAAIGLCALALVPGVGANINGSNRWLKIGNGPASITFQPSELVKWLIIPTLAWYCMVRGPKMRSFREGMAPALLLIALSCGLIAKEDLGTAVLIGTVALIVLIAGGGSLLKLSPILPICGAAIAVLIYIEPYRVKRLVAFLDPFADPQGIGYHPIQAMIALSSGAAPSGIGGSIQKHGYLPADTTDFIFPVIVEETGLWGAAVILILFGLLMIGCYMVLKSSRDPFGRLLTLGVMSTVGLQAIMNIAVATVVAPTKGIALPLISSGGTGWALCATALGAVIAVNRLHHLLHNEDYAAANKTGYADQAEMDTYEENEPVELALNIKETTEETPKLMGWNVPAAFRLHREDPWTENDMEEDADETEKAFIDGSITMSDSDRFKPLALLQKARGAMSQVKLGGGDRGGVLEKSDRLSDQTTQRKVPESKNATEISGISIGAPPL